MTSRRGRAYDGAMIMILGLAVAVALVAALVVVVAGGRRAEAEAPEPFPLPGSSGKEPWRAAPLPSPVADTPAAAPDPGSSADDLPPGDGPRAGSIGLPGGGSLVARFAVRTHQGTPDGITTHRAAALPPAGVLFVTDGFGPFGAGMTNAVAADEIRRSIAAKHRAGGPSSPAGEALASAISSANEEVFAFTRDHREFAGSGATVAAVALRPGGSAVAHVGAERVYRVRGGVLEQLTEDHSIINDFIRMKSITDEAEKRALRREGPHRNVIVRALGMKQGVRADVADLELRAGDRLLIATKRLGDALLEDELQALLAAPGPVEGLCEAVLAEAIKAAPMENHAAIAIAIEEA